VRRRPCCARHPKIISRTICYTIAVILVFDVFGVPVLPLSLAVGAVVALFGAGDDAAPARCDTGLLSPGRRRVGRREMSSISVAIAGVVEKLTLRGTWLRDEQGNTHILSNRDITNVVGAPSSPGEALMPAAAKAGEMPPGRPARTASEKVVSEFSFRSASTRRTLYDVSPNAAETAQATHSRSQSSVQQQRRHWRPRRLYARCRCGCTRRHRQRHAARSRVPFAASCKFFGHATPKTTSWNGAPSCRNRCVCWTNYFTNTVAPAQKTSPAINEANPTTHEYSQELNTASGDTGTPQTTPQRPKPQDRSPKTNDQSPKSDNCSLDTEITYLKGVGPKRAEALNKLGMHTVYDLLYYFPNRYEDRRVVKPISQVEIGAKESVCATVLFPPQTRRMGGRMGNRPLTKVRVGDASGRADLQWWNQPFREKQFQPGMQLFIYGKLPSSTAPCNRHARLRNHGENDTLQVGRIVPVYPMTEGLFQSAVRRAIANALEKCGDSVDEVLPETVRQQFELKPLPWCLRQIHFPDDWAVKRRSACAVGL
jgi:predicted flap endonuclease-1-like 5' DNA nuclease